MLRRRYVVAKTLAEEAGDRPPFARTPPTPEVAVLEPIAVALDADDLGVVQKTVDHGGGHHGVIEGLGRSQPPPAATRRRLLGPSTCSWTAGRRTRRCPPTTPVDLPTPPPSSPATGPTPPGAVLPHISQESHNPRVMASHLDPDRPPKSSWILAGVAGALALAGAVALWWLAEEWATDPDRTNVYTFVAAVGGVVVFEFLRFALTIRSRHRRAVEDQFRLRDVRAEQVKKLLHEVSASRQALAAVEAAIELRARQRNLHARRDGVKHALDEVTTELRAIRTEEQLLGVAADELNLTEEAACRLNDALAHLEPMRGRPRNSVLELTVGGLPLGLGMVSLVLIDLVEKRTERNRIKRVSQAAGRHGEESEGKNDLDGP